MFGCVLPCRGGSWPEINSFDAWLASIASCVSNKAMSIWAPCPSSLAQERREDRDAGVEACEQIDDRHADAHRATARDPVGQAGDAHQSAHALDDVIVAGAVGVRAVLTKASDRGIDQPRVRCSKRLGVESELLEAADLEILDDDVRPLRKLKDERRAFRLSEIDCGRFLAAIAAKEIGSDPVIPFTMPWRAPMAGIVAVHGTLDLEHLRAEIRQQLRAPRAREHPAQVEHLDAFKWLQCRRPQNRRSASTAWAALWPGAPVTPPPGCAPEPHR